MSIEKTDVQLCTIVDKMCANDIVSSGSYKADNKYIFDRYNAEDYGDEEEGLSTIKTTEVADTVDSDMVSYVRVFLSGNRPVEFEPLNASDQNDVKEAEIKNAYIQHILDGVDDSYIKQFNWLKEMDLQQMGWLEYGVEEEEKPITRSYHNLTPIEFQIKSQELAQELAVDVKEIEIESQEEVQLDGESEQRFDFKAKVTKTRQKFFIQNVPWEDMIITRNVQTKSDADIFGKRFRIRRGDLVAQGYDKELVAKIPTFDANLGDDVKTDRYKRQSGDNKDTGSQEWANQEVEGQDVYALIDWDDDDIAERRHVIKVGNDIVLENEPHDHIPYAGGSVIPMPHNIVGKSRAQLSLEQQRISTVFSRHISDNASAVNQGRAFVDSKTVNMEDYFNSAKHGAIRVKGNPSASVFPDPVMYHGDKTLQVLAHFDSLQAKRTGQIITNQALTSDQLHKETATRFQGMQQAASGKIELASRNIAEGPYTMLYEGLAWMAYTHQDTEQEFAVLGQQISVIPSDWENEHKAKSKVGTGFDDDEAKIQTLTGLLQLISQEQEAGSGLSDSQKKYNVYKELVRSTGLHGVENFFNDPSQPIQTVIAENEILKRQLAQLQQMMENPLEGAEKIKQQGSIMRDQMKYQHDKQMKAVDVNQENTDRATDAFFKAAELELQYNTDIPGQGL